TSKRLKKIVDYINEELDTEIIIVENYDNSNVNDISIEFKLEYTSNIKFVKMLEMSKYAIHLGFYPYPEKIHLKHIIIDNLEDINYIDDSIFLNSSINSVIFYQYGNEENISTRNIVFPMILNQEILENSSDIVFIDLPRDKLKDEIVNFIRQGKINKNDIHINDIGRYRKSLNLNTLFIKNKNIYVDFKHEINISKNIASTIFEMLNNLKQGEIILNYSNEIYVHFHLCKILAHENKVDKFVTYLTNNKLPNLNNIAEAKFSRWIGFIEPDGKFLYDSLNNKTYEVNDIVFEIFEYLTKGREELLEERIDMSLIEDVKGMLS
ncbi:hypothetical protein BU092_08885, partial [Staphylococcus warneri]|uniref:hypothetical protein n=1 Tax=Staphylococcus warneri TaxID=1292 RepID=UPI000FF4D39F